MHWCSMQCRSAQCAIYTHAACNMELCNVHRCSTQLTTTRCPACMAAAGAALTRSTRTATAQREPAGMGRRTDRRTHRLTPPQHSVTGVLVRHQGPGGSGGWVCKGIPSRTQQALCQQPQQQHGQARRQQQQQRRGPHGCSAAARMQHLGDGVVWMQSTSCVCVTPIPPPKLSDRGLRGQSSLSLQRLTEAGLQPAVLHPVGQHPPLLLCHPPPPRTHIVLLGHRAACTDGACMHGTCAAVQRGGRTDLRVQTVQARVCTPSHPAQLCCLQLC